MLGVLFVYTTPKYCNQLALEQWRNRRQSIVGQVSNYLKRD